MASSKKIQPTSLIRPGDRPEKDGEGSAYNIEKDLVSMMSDEIKDPDYLDDPVNEDRVDKAERALARLLGENRRSSGSSKGRHTMMEKLRRGASELSFDNGITIPVDRDSRRKMLKHLESLSTQDRSRLLEHIKRSHANFLRALSVL